MIDVVQRGAAMRKGEGKTGCVVITIALAGGVGLFAWMAMDSGGPAAETNRDGDGPTVATLEQTPLDEADSYNEILRTAAERDARAIGVASGGPEAAADAPARRAPTFTGWREGPMDYRRAMDARGTTSGPMALLFYVDWCGYCRHMNDEILASSEARGYFNGIPAVKINPDDGAEHKKIAEEWGVSGYPAFFILPEGSTRGSKVHPYKTRNGERTSMSGEAFVQACRASGGG
jgi:thiol-disulfide isomerase/thioredoxin